LAGAPTSQRAYEEASAAGGPADAMEAPPESLEDAFESLDFRFLLNLPDSELEVPERLFFQIEQVGPLAAGSLAGRLVPAWPRAAGQG